MKKAKELLKYVSIILVITGCSNQVDSVIIKMDSKVVQEFGKELSSEILETHLPISKYTSKTVNDDIVLVAPENSSYESISVVTRNNKVEAFSIQAKEFKGLDIEISFGEDVDPIKVEDLTECNYKQLFKGILIFTSLCDSLNDLSIINTYKVKDFTF